MPEGGASSNLCHSSFGLHLTLNSKAKGPQNQMKLLLWLV